MIFLDNASTTSLSPNAVDVLIKYSTDDFYNPSAIYKKGYENYKQIQEVKQLLATKLGAEFKNNIIFTGSATEASNLAIMGSLKKSFKKMIFSMGEHPSVYNTALNLKQSGFNVVFIDLKSTGEIDYDKLECELNEDVAFISVMHVSNETGAINDIARINQLRNKYCPNALLHCDGVQAFGKIETDVMKLGVDFYTISAHKLHGPKGLGALYVKNPLKLKPVMHGGGQEYALRSGTENLASIMAFKTALEEIDIEKNLSYVNNLKSKFLEVFGSVIDKKIDVKFIENAQCSPYVISISIAKIKGETLVYMCDEKGVMISTGSACSSKKSGNRILENMGYNNNEITGNIRVSFSNYTTVEEVVAGAEIIANNINELYSKVN